MFSNKGEIMNPIQTHLIIILAVLSAIAFFCAAGIESLFEINWIKGKPPKIKYIITTLHDLVRSLGITLFIFGVVGVINQTTFAQNLVRELGKQLWHVVDIHAKSQGYLIKLREI
jgi:hypothetical protein